MADPKHRIFCAVDTADLEAALRFMAAEGMELIVTSGGLGPTADDLTGEVVAKFAGRELLLDEEVEEKIAAILRGFARRFNFDEEAVREANRKQAMVPEGSLALDPVGTAPGLVVPAGESVVIVLPGPLRELRPMWPRAIESRPVQAILARTTPLLAYTVRMFGIPESEIAKSLREIEAGGVELTEVEITTCLRRGVKSPQGGGVRLSSLVQPPWSKNPAPNRAGEGRGVATPPDCGDPPAPAVSAVLDGGDWSTSPLPVEAIEMVGPPPFQPTGVEPFCEVPLADEGACRVQPPFTDRPL